MWAHYTGQHTGGVIGFKCIDKPDSLLFSAMQVTYSKEMPRSISVDDLAKSFIGIGIDFNEIINSRDNFKVFSCTKSKQWEYEKEWRCINKAVDPTKTFDLVSIDPREIDSVFLGCRAKNEFRDKVVSFNINELDHVKFYRAEPDNREFNLNFPPI